jgi:hypothetical protein
VPLARAYVADGGRIVAMLGKAEAVGASAVRSFELPFSRAPRAVATYRAQR